MTRHIYFGTFSDEGFVTEAELTPAGDGVDRWEWAGDGSGAGTLTIEAGMHYMAIVQNVVQHFPAIRQATRIVCVHEGQLDLGVVDAEG